MTYPNGLTTAEWQRVIKDIAEAAFVAGADWQESHTHTDLRMLDERARRHAERVVTNLTIIEKAPL